MITTIAARCSLGISQGLGSLGIGPCCDSQSAWNKQQCWRKCTGKMAPGIITIQALLKRFLFGKFWITYLVELLFNHMQILNVLAKPPSVRHLHSGWITMPSTDLTSCPKAPSTNDCRSTQRLNLDATLSLCHWYHVVTICYNAFQQLSFSSSSSSAAASSYCRHLHHPMTVNIASLKQKPWMSSDQPICQEIGSPSESLSFW